MQDEIAPDKIGLLQEMRAALNAALPAQAFLKRDRGDGLFITNAPVFAPNLERIPGFLLEKRGVLLHILPDQHWFDLLERRFPKAPNLFCETFVRFRSLIPKEKNLRLFAQIAKLCDAGASANKAELDACDRALRSRCAEALRGKNDGGGLYASALMLTQFHTLYKGESAP